MADLEIHIGGRSFMVSCQPGEEHFLNAAAQMLDIEAQPLVAQMGRLPEARMLLMAGLMLADKTAAVEDENRQLKAKLAEIEALWKPFAFGRGTTTLAGALGAALRERGLTMALAESCTGGLAGSLVTAESGSPSSSQTSCESTVSEPWPISEAPVISVTWPKSSSFRIVPQPSDG